MDMHFVGTLVTVLQGRWGHCWRQLGAAGVQRENSEQGASRSWRRLGYLAPQERSHNQEPLTQAQWVRSRKSLARCGRQVL